jgi:hypothetical protein
LERAQSLRYPFNVEEQQNVGGMHSSLSSIPPNSPDRDQSVYGIPWQDPNEIAFSLHPHSLTLQTSNAHNLLHPSTSNDGRLLLRSRDFAFNGLLREDILIRHFVYIAFMRGIICDNPARKQVWDFRRAFRWRYELLILFLL